MRRIAFINEKGGTCKTTLCVNVAARLAARGLRVLVADLDTQGHAGKALGVDVRGLSPTIRDVLVGSALSVVDVAGRTVKRLLDGPLPAGTHVSVWDGVDDRGARVTGGVYFARLRVDEALRSSRIVFLGD